MKKVLLLLMAAALMGMPVEAKKKDKKKKGKAKTEAAAPAPAPKKKEVKPSISRKGMLNVEKVGTDWFLEVPDSLLGKDILAVTRYTSTPSSSGKFGGEECNEQVVFFQMNPDSTILLRSRMTINLADSTEAISKAINVSNEHPIIGAFKVEKHKDGLSRIKVTAFLNSDHPGHARRFPVLCRGYQDLPHQHRDPSCEDLQQRWQRTPCFGIHRQGNLRSEYQSGTPARGTHDAPSV